VGVPNKKGRMISKLEKRLKRKVNGAGHAKIRGKSGGGVKRRSVLESLIGEGSSRISNEDRSPIGSNKGWVSGHRKRGKPGGKTTM